MKSWNLAIVLAVAAGSTLSVSAQSSSWLDATSGDWNDPARWDNGVPGSGFDVVIDATGAAYTSTVSSTFDINDLLLDSADATLRLANSGVLNLAGTATIASGTLRFDGGRIVGGTLSVDPSGVVSFSSGSNNILDGVTVLGDLELDESNSALRIRNGTTVSGTIGLTGNSARLGLEGTQTFNGTIVQSAGNSAQVTIEGTSTLTLGAGGSISGTRLDIGSAFAIGGDRTLINDGTITATGANATGVRLLSMTSLTNNGLLEAINGGRLQVLSSVEAFVNNGVFAIGSGATGDIGSSNWQNAGQITVSDGTLNLGGSFTTAGSGLNTGGITGNAGATLNLTGVLDNTGDTLASDVFGGSFVLNGGTIIGGTLSFANADDWTITSSSTNIFDGVAVVGDLDLGGSSSALRLRNGTSVSGTIGLTGNSARLGFEGTQAFDGTIVQSLGSSAQITIEGTSTLTLGAGGSISGTRLDIGSAFAIGGDRTLINDGTITATGANATGVRLLSLNSLTNNGLLEAINGGRLQLLNSVGVFANDGMMTAEAGSSLVVGAGSWTNGGSIAGTGASVAFDGSWENLGTVSVTGGSLDLGGAFTTAGSGFRNGRIDRTGSTVTLSGTLDNTGATLSTADLGGLVTLNGGRIIGGSFTVANTADIGFSTNSNNILEGVAVAGDLELAGTSSSLRIRNGTGVSGSILLTGNNARLGLEGTQTFTGTIAQSSGSFAQVTIEGNATATIGAGSLITGTRLDIGSAFAVGGTRTLINRGTFSADGVNSTGMRFTAIDTLSNESRFEAINGSTLRVLSSVGAFTNTGEIAGGAGTNVLIEAASWSNGASGSIASSGGDVLFAGDWANLGTVSVQNGRLSLGGAFTTAETGFLDGRVDRTGSVLEISGLMDNTQQAIATTDFGGAVTLVGGRILGGSLTVADRSDLVFSTNSNNALDGVAVVGDLELADTSSSLRLRNGTGVSGTILLTGNNARMGLEGTQIFTGTIAQSSGSFAQVTIEGNATATIGAGSVVTGTRLDIGSAFAVGGTRTLINRGTFSADGVNSTGMRFTAIDTLTNEGVFEAVNGGRLTVLSSVDDFTNLDAGVLAGGVYRIGAESRMDLGAPIVNNAAEIELLGANATLVGLDALATNTGSLTLGGPATLDLAGGIVLGPDGVFRLAVGGAGDSAITPLLSAAGVAELGGDLVLDFSGYSLGGITGATTYTFLTGASITGAFASVDVLGLDPSLVSFDGGPGTFTLVPAPGAGVLFGLAAVRVTRRRRAGC